MEFSKLQREILDKKDKKIVVMASAASGKSALITEKTRQILRSGIDPKLVAVITFTNMAAEELRKRLGEDYKDGIYIGTVHGLANNFLLSNGIDTSRCLKEEDFDKLFSLVKQNVHCIKEYSYVLLDEAQDSGDLEFEFIFDMINPEHFFVAGDLKQSIYGFKGSKPELLFKLSRQPDVTSCSLNENYRNGHNILQYAKRIIRPTGMIDDSIALAELPGSVFECSYGLEKISTMILKDGNYGNWAVLTRTNAEISDLIYVFSKMGIPYDTFKQSKVSKDELNKKMTQDTVKVLTIHSAKGLEWENVAVIGTRTRPDEEKNVCYVAATRAKQRLIWMGGKPKKSSQPKSKTRVYNWG